MKSKKQNILKIGIKGLFLSFILLIFQSCATPNTEELFSPADVPTCFDKVLNQGEYFTDCGGPCPQCALQVAVNYNIVEKTWEYPGPTDIPVNSSKITTVVNGDLIEIEAIDEFANITIRFAIDRTWRGVHEVSDFTGVGSISGPGLSMNFESGVVSIVNVDETNGYLSGTFSFISQADLSTGRRFSVLDGEFKDIPNF